MGVKMTTFFQLTAEQLVKKSKIIEIGKMINWEKMRYRFKKLYKDPENRNNIGQKPYDVMSMVIVYKKIAFKVKYLRI